MTAVARMQGIQQLAYRKALASNDATRRRCFISYHVDDADAVESFIENYGDVFIGTCVGVTDDDDFVESTNEDYIKRRIREKYLADTTVTIVLVGECTKSRKWVDWEIASSLRDNPADARSGLLGINLPHVGSRALAPERLADNRIKDNPGASYAEYYSYPSAKVALRAWIEEAFAARSAKGHLVKNSRPLRQRNTACP